MGNKLKSLVIIDMHSLSFVNKEGNFMPSKFSFPKGSFSDMEVTDPVLLEAALKEFLNSKNISSELNHLYIIISSNLTFQKMLSPDSNFGQEKRKYLDSVPFEAVGFKVFPQGKNIKIVAFNKSFVDTLASIFEKLKFNVEAVVLAANLPQAIQDLEDTKKFKKILNKGDLASLSVINDFSKPNLPKTTPGPKQKSNMPVLTLLVLAAFLILGLSIYFSFSNSGKRHVSPKPAATQAPAILNNKEPEVKVFYREQARESAIGLQNLLWNEGYKNAEIESTNTSQTGTKLQLPAGLSVAQSEKVKALLSSVLEEYQTTTTTDTKVVDIVLLLDEKDLKKSDK